MENKNVIGISAPVGSGKTELATLLGKVLDTKVFFEPVTEEENPVLPLFYKDKGQYGFLLQIFFLNTRFRQIKAAYKEKNGIIDSTIYTDRLFLTRLYKDGQVSKEELDTYLNLFDNMMEEIAGLPYKKTPDLMISIDLSLETELSRIFHRGRGFEQGSDQYNYWQSLLNDYREWESGYKESELFHVDGDHYDFVNDLNDRNKVVGDILAKLQDMNLLSTADVAEALQRLASLNKLEEPAQAAIAE